MTKTTPSVATFARKAAIILPVLKLIEEQAVYFEVTAPFYVGKAVEKDGKEEKPADLVKVVNLQTGEEAIVVAGHVLKSNIEESFPDQTYVGKKFEATKHAKTNGKRYNTYSLFELV